MGLHVFLSIYMDRRADVPLPEAHFVGPFPCEGTANTGDKRSDGRVAFLQPSVSFSKQNEFK